MIVCLSVSILSKQVSFMNPNMSYLFDYMERFLCINFCLYHHHHHHHHHLLRHELSLIILTVPLFLLFSSPLFFGPPLWLKDTSEFLLYLLQPFLQNIWSSFLSNIFNHLFDKALVIMTKFLWQRPLLFA